MNADDVNVQLLANAQAELVKDGVDRLMLLLEAVKAERDELKATLAKERWLHAEHGTNRYIALHKLGLVVEHNPDGSVEVKNVS